MTMWILVYAFGLVAAQTTQSGCTCKSYSEVRWRSPSGSMEGGFSHSGCGVGPFENYGPGKGRNWCDTVQTSCNNGQGWDLCIRSSAPPMPPVRAEQVNVNQAWSTASIQTSTKGPGVNLNVNVNVKGGVSGSQQAITTVRGCTCHPTSEVIVLQNGVRVGGGFSHTGCGTGPFEANSPGKGSPWCDTIETWCSDGWDLCVPPSSQQNSYTSQNLVGSTNSYTSYSNPATYQQFFPPSPSSQARYTSQSQQPSAYIVQPSKSSRSPFSPPKNSRQSGSRSQRNSRGGYFDYDYDVPSSNSNLLPLMLLSGSSSSNNNNNNNNNLLPFMLATQNGGSNNNNLLPLMLASQGTSSKDNMLPLMLATQGGGSNSNMLPMMMMMGSGGLSSSNPMTTFAMLSAFREGDGQAQEVDKLGQTGESLGFTRAVVVKPSAETDVDGSSESPDVAESA